jgi:omega-hydroxy-beta-dihydromenaquinone-9 sulfotransferase
MILYQKAFFCSVCYMKYFSASFYYVRYSILGKIIRETYRHFNIRVWLLSVLFIFLYFLHQLISLLFRVIDELFHRGYKQVNIKQPVFIIANPRSGTTFLHRLVSLDTERFIYTKYAHTFFMTSSFVNFYYLFRWLDRKVLRGRISKGMDVLDETFWGGWDDIHAMGFNKAEEDELLFAQAMMSTGVFLPFPYFHLIHDNKFLDNEPAEVRKNMMDFYESCVKRFVFAAGKDKTYLAKNVMSTGRFKTLMQRFPDAKIIYIARHPYDSVASFASMFTAMHKLHSPGMPDNDPSKKAWAQLGIDFFKYTREMRRTIPASQFIELKYDDLLDNPQGTVLNIYRYFGWEASPAFVSALSHGQAQHRHYKSGHEYSLEQYGFTKQEVYEQLKDVMDEFGFEKEF